MIEAMGCAETTLYAFMLVSVSAGVILGVCLSVWLWGVK